MEILEVIGLILKLIVVGSSDVQAGLIIYKRVKLKPLRETYVYYH